MRFSGLSKFQLAFPVASILPLRLEPKPLVVPVPQVSAPEGDQSVSVTTIGAIFAIG